MEQKVYLKYINKELKVGMVNWKQVYLLHPVVTPLMLEVDKERLVYRAKGSNRRISYQRIKEGLVKTNECIIEEISSWLPEFK